LIWYCTMTAGRAVGEGVGIVGAGEGAVGAAVGTADGSCMRVVGMGVGSVEGRPSVGEADGTAVAVGRGVGLRVACRPLLSKPRSPGPSSASCP
jgi:hypothetical protein